MRSLRTRLLRALGAAGVWSLVAFHAALLGRRLAEPGALDATAALRWAATLLIVGMALALRSKASRLTRRQLLALALAAVALHAPMLQGPAEADRAAAFWITLPAVLAPALALCALLAARRAGRAPAGLLVGSLAASPASVSRVPFSARPPPLL